MTRCLVLLLILMLQSSNYSFFINFDKWQIRRFNPVAIIYFASTVSLVPSAFAIATWVASQPNPSRTVILFFVH
jgi:hypothetical protein